MYSDGSALEHLSRDECLLLAASVSVGRVIYTRRALPAVDLVNFAFDHGDIIIRTERGSKLAAATQHSVVAFETDRLDADQRAGWSVTAIGQSRGVTDPAEISRLRKIGLSSGTWPPCFACTGSADSQRTGPAGPRCRRSTGVGRVSYLFGCFWRAAT
jgi:hypothetical protein